MLPYAQVLKCHFCKMFAHLLDNPYLYTGQLIAKLSVNLATMIWSAVVFVKPGALSTWPGRVFADTARGEDWLSILLFLLALAATLRLLFKSVPLNMGACVYGIFLLLWLYTWSTLVLAIYEGITAMRPGQLAGVTVITALAVFAFVSNPKRRYGSPAN